MQLSLGRDDPEGGSPRGDPEGDDSGYEAFRVWSVQVRGGDPGAVAAPSAGSPRGWKYGKEINIPR